LSPLNLIALVCFLAVWLGYTAYADTHARGRSLMHAANLHRRDWMATMLARDNRIVDMTVVATLSRSVLFFAQTSIFIIAGLLASFGAAERIAALLLEMPYASPGTLRELHLKLALLTAIFIYAFFKFTWSMRLFNYLSVLIGAAPLPGAAPVPPGAPEGDPLVARGARLGELAVDHFNRGIRGYYFGLAVLPWFADPVLFVIATLWVVVVLWRREFQSNTLAAMGE
jgi:uncharacterized membrane protein